MTLERYMDEFGNDLARAGRARRRRRRRARLALVLPGAAALAVAAAVLGGADGGDDAIAQAREALAPSGEIVHMTVRMRMGANVMGPTVEQWYAGEPERWRAVQSFDPPRATRRRDAPALVAMPEIAFFNDRVRMYDKRRDVVRIYENMRLLKPMGPSMVGGDPSTDLRDLLAKGDVRDDGVVTVDGRSVRRLVSEQKDPGPPRRLVYYMDPQTFAPLGGRMYFSLGKRRAPVLEFTVEGYERIPLNAETEKLLKFDKTPDTRYVWHDVKRGR